MRARPVVLLLGLWLSGLLTSASAAQQDQPIFPAYDGYLKNPDGSYTLSFAYFSHNAVTVTIAPGAHNEFAPAPADRQQPMTFKPGHWRFQCVMVVGPDFDGTLTWTLAYAGTTTGTSQRMLQSNWHLVEGADELKHIDYAKVPRGVCLNRAPNVRVLGVGRDGRAPVRAVVGERYSLFGSVNDEGLPRGSTLRSEWTQRGGPGRVTLERPTSPRTRATFSAPGEYELELTATDSVLTNAARITVTVSAK